VNAFTPEASVQSGSGILKSTRFSKKARCCAARRAGGSGPRSATPRHPVSRRRGARAAVRSDAGRRDRAAADALRDESRRMRACRCSRRTHASRRRCPRDERGGHLVRVREAAPRWCARGSCSPTRSLRSDRRAEGEQVDDGELGIVGDDAEAGMRKKPAVATSKSPRLNRSNAGDMPFLPGMRGHVRASLYFRAYRR
jgi:hypothetical protein